MPIGVYERRHYMRNWRKLSDAQVARAMALRASGWSLRALAWSFGVGITTIRRNILNGAPPTGV
jgi:hypothetical protein